MSTKRSGSVWVSRVAVIALLMGIVSQAGEAFQSKGMYEAGFGATWTKLDVDGMDAHFLVGQADLSYFLTDGLSLGAGIVGAYLVDAADIEEDAALLGLEVNLRYHLPAIGCAVPYVGIHGGWAYMEAGDDTDDGLMYGAHAGIKYPITANVFFDTQVKYTIFEMDEAELDLDTLQVLFGIRYYFGEGANASAGGGAEPAPYEAGDIELSFAGGYNWTTTDTGGDDQDSHTINASGNAAYFVTDAISVGVGALGMYVIDAGDVDEDTLLIGAELSADYHFCGLGRLVPYLGLHGGYGYITTGESEHMWEYGAHGGVKYLVTDTVFINAQLRYTKFDLDDNDIDVDLDATQAMVGLGFRL